LLIVFTAVFLVINDNAEILSGALAENVLKSEFLLHSHGFRVDRRDNYLSIVGSSNGNPLPVLLAVFLATCSGSLVQTHGQAKRAIDTAPT